MIDPIQPIVYTADHGLQVLIYLGLTNTTDKEREVFREKWQELYRSDPSLINTSWKLYAEVLPFICGDGDRGSLLAAHYRDEEFGERLKATELEKELSLGSSLESILEKGPHTFITKIV